MTNKPGLKKLKREMKAAERRERPSTITLEEILAPLTERIRKTDPTGEVCTILVYDAHGKINCYGAHIQPEMIFNALNLTIGTQGTHLTGTISYPQLDRLASTEKAKLYRGVKFGLQPNQYVALVNIPSDPEEEYIR
jgi:hypothetical protein